MRHLKNILLVVSVSLLFLELCLHLPYFDIRMKGLWTLFSESRYFANRKETDELQPSEKMYDPYLGWRAGPKKSKTMEREHFNSMGWRSKTEFQKEKTKKRVVILGDSFFYGQGLNDEDTIHYRLQELLGEKYEVYNFAVEGYSWDQIYAVATLEAPKYAPDWLIIGTIKNDLDLERNCLEYAWGGVQKPTFRIKEGNVFSPNSPVPNPQETLLKNSTPLAKLKNHSLALLSDLGLSRAVGVLVTRSIQDKCWHTSVKLLENIAQRYQLKERLVFAELDPLPEKFSLPASQLPLTYIKLYDEEKRLADAAHTTLDTTDGFHPGKKTNAFGAAYLGKLILEKD